MDVKGEKMFKSGTKSESKSKFPGERGEAVLSAVVGEHLASGVPVGSKAIAGKIGDRVSAATIRGVMSELEKRGYLKQPHVSAGRVPTDQGYRFYVDNLLGVLSISEGDLRIINESLGNEGVDGEKTFDELMEEVSQLLSGLSDSIGIVVSPAAAHNRLEHIEFVKLSDKRVVVVLVSPPDIVHHKVMRIKEELSQEELDRTSSYLNEEFWGKSLLEMRAEILALMHEEQALFDNLLQTAMKLCFQSIEESEKVEHGEVYVDGTSNMLTKQGFSGDTERLQRLLQTVEERSRLVGMLNECIAEEKKIGNQARVLIGKENSAEAMKECAIITAPYCVGDETSAGTLSVLGSTRIEYARMIAVVSYVAGRVEEIMTGSRKWRYAWEGGEEDWRRKFLRGSLEE